MAHNFESISTSVVRKVRISPLAKIEGVSTLRKAWQSIPQPLLGRNALAAWEQELLAAQGRTTFEQDDVPQSEQEAGARAGLKTFVEMERWLTNNGFAIVRVSDE
jgi:hypothetical protein